MNLNKLRSFFSSGISGLKQNIPSVTFRSLNFIYYRILWLVCIFYVDKLLLSTLLLTLFEFIVSSNSSTTFNENILSNFYPLLISFLLVSIQLSIHNPVGYIHYFGLSLLGYFSMLTFDQSGSLNFLQKDYFKFSTWINLFKTLTNPQFWNDFKVIFMNNISKTPESWGLHLSSMLAGVCLSFPYFKFVSNLKFVHSIVLLPFGFIPHKVNDVFQKYEEKSFKKNMD